MPQRHLWLALTLLTGTVFAAPANHTVTFGKWTVVKWYVGGDESRAQDMKVRPLYVDNRQKVFTLGPVHDVTDRLFVVRRALRVNDALPQESTSSPRWRWSPGGWLRVDRITGRISSLSLPDFDFYYSLATWFRDYAAYCGVSDDGEKLYALIAQIGSRKPILKKALGKPSTNDEPDSLCLAPTWERQPVRVSFETANQKFTYAVRSHLANLVDDDEAEEEQSAK
jgi:hypothetical protein